MPNVFVSLFACLLVGSLCMAQAKAWVCGTHRGKPTTPVRDGAWGVHRQTLVQLPAPLAAGVMAELSDGELVGAFKLPRVGVGRNRRPDQLRAGLRGRH